MFLDANSSITMHQLQVLREVFRSSTLQKNRWAVFTYKMTFFIRTNLCSKKENGQISQGKKKRRKTQANIWKTLYSPCPCASHTDIYFSHNLLYIRSPSNKLQRDHFSSCFVHFRVIILLFLHSRFGFFYSFAAAFLFFLRHRFIFNSFCLVIIKCLRKIALGRNVCFKRRHISQR